MFWIDVLIQEINSFSSGSVSLRCGPLLPPLRLRLRHGYRKRRNEIEEMDFTEKTEEQEREYREDEAGKYCCCLLRGEFKFQYFLKGEL